MEMNEMEMDMEEVNNDEIRKKMKIQFLKVVLNILRARLIIFKSECQLLRNNLIIPEHMISHDCLREHNHGLMNDVLLLQTLQECVSVVHNNITCAGVSNLNDQQQRSELVSVVLEIAYCSRFLMKLYEEEMSEMEKIRQKQNYMTEINQYNTDITMLKENKKPCTNDAEELRRLQKAELLVKKINFMRQMKFIFIGASSKCVEKYPQLQRLRTAFRKNLTIDDFYETWDVGLSPQATQHD